MKKINKLLVILCMVLIPALGSVVMSIQKNKERKQVMMAKEPAPDAVKMAQNEVAIVEGTFGITQKSIPLNSVIMWTNRDKAKYTLISRNNAFPDKDIPGYSSFSFMFTKPGEYFFTLQGSTNALLRVTVQ